MPISEEEAQAIRTEVLSIREDFVSLSRTVRGQADSIRTSGNRLNEIFTQLRRISPTETQILLDEIDQIEQSLSDVVEATRGLRGRGSR